METTVTHKAKYWAIIPAAGVGQRMKTKTFKPYLKIDQKTIVEHTVSLFSGHPLIEAVILVLHPDDAQWATLGLRYSGKVVTTPGGETRADSVMCALGYLEPMAAADDWVLVHDVARPCLLPTVLDHFIRTVEDHRIGGLLATPITDTVKKVDTDHGVRETIPRDNLWAAQTPQMFRYGLLFDAMEKALKANAVITDESSAIEFSGEHPLVVPGDWRNIKITTVDDLEQAKGIINK